MVLLIGSSPMEVMALSQLVTLQTRTLPTLKRNTDGSFVTTKHLAKKT